MPSASSTAVTVAAVAAGCSLLAYGASRLTKSSAPQSPSLNEIDDIDAEIDGGGDDCISPDDVVAIFDKLFMTMQQVVLQLSQQVQQIQMAGQVIPEQQLRQLLKGEFERALAQCQAQVFEDNDVDADCLEEATWEFMDSPDEYPKVKRAVERFQKMYDSISGEDTFGWTPNKAKNASGGAGSLASGAKKDLTPDELMKAATVYFDTITALMVEMAKSWKAQGKDISNPQIAKQYLMEASTDANEAAENKLEKEMGIHMTAFRAAIDKHSKIPAVGQTLGMLQMKQQQELMAAGIPMM